MNVIIKQRLATSCECVLVAVERGSALSFANLEWLRARRCSSLFFFGERERDGVASSKQSGRTLDQDEHGGVLLLRR